MDGCERVVVRDAKTGEKLEEAVGTETAVETKEDWYRKGGRDIRAIHIHPDVSDAVPSPDDLMTALEERSECETVVAEFGGFSTLHPRNAEKLRRDKTWRGELEKWLKLLADGGATEAEWREWLFDRRDVFGFGEGAR